MVLSLVRTQLFLYFLMGVPGWGATRLPTSGEERSLERVPAAAAALRTSGSPWRHTLEKREVPVLSRMSAAIPAQSQRHRMLRGLRSKSLKVATFLASRILNPGLGSEKYPKADRGEHRAQYLPSVTVERGPRKGLPCEGWDVCSDRERQK